MATACAWASARCGSGAEAFREHGWRTPNTSRNPFKESFGNRTNSKYVAARALRRGGGAGRGLVRGAVLRAHVLQSTVRIAWNQAIMIALLALQMVYVLYGPIAAFLVELFPTRIRYTSMSLPSHLDNGWFGGFLPLIATAVTASAWAHGMFGDGVIYAGLIYPIVVCIVTVIVGGLFMCETEGYKIDVDFRRH